MIDLQKLLTRLPRESADAIVAQARFSSRTLSETLRTRLSAPPGAPDSIVAEPAVEGAFPWLPFAGGWNALPNGLLHPKALDVLRIVAPPPYEHQVDAWMWLTQDTPHSVIVSSGTGSGKTECFLTPLLDRLARTQGDATAPMRGVRALMLYPLNALINSQEERLARWFEPYGGKLRYCLYNGATPEQEKAEKKRLKPWRVLDRKDLRAAPPPVLVTNITMLEYMLIRQKDADILDASQGTLDFVILDEAHSYVGAQAAELALLLRRVALAFGRNPEDIRYVATSATIGNDADEELHRFLCGISGAPADRVHLVKGKRAPLPPAPALVDTAITLDALDAASPAERGAMLAASRPLRALRERLHGGDAVPWTEWRHTIQTISGSTPDDAESARWLTHAASAADPRADAALVRIEADRVLPTRLHLFHGSVSGAWTCANSACSGRPSEGDWPFGAIYLDQRETCRHCQSLVFELGVCVDCGATALRGEERDAGARLAPWPRSSSDDDFAQTIERLDEEIEDEEEAEDDGVGPPVERRAFYTSAPAIGRMLNFDPRTGTLSDGPADGSIRLTGSGTEASCVCCGASPRRQNPAMARCVRSASARPISWAKWRR